MENLDTPITPELPVEPQPLRYVTYAADGTLEECLLQVPPEEHADRMIVIDETLAPAWVNYRANEARDGLELLKPVQPPAPSEAQLVAAYMAEVQRHMDRKAVDYGYDNLLSVITYAEEPSVERYQVEGQAFRAWRSLCWAKCEEVLAVVKAEARSAPSFAELIAEMPKLGLGAPAHFAT